MHISAKEPEESAHSVNFDLTISCSVEMFPGLVEVLVQVVLSFFAFESKMGINNFVGGLLGIKLLEDELSGGLTFWGGELEGILGDHGVHELVII